MKITKIKNLRFPRPDQSIVDMDIEINGEWMSFTADPNDPLEHGRNLYQKAIEGKLGTIQPYQGE